MFLILDGVMHDLPSWKVFGGYGTVSGISNIAPASTVRLWNLCCVENRSTEQDEDLREVPSVLSKVDAAVMPLGFRVLSEYLNQIQRNYADCIVEYLLGYLHGYGRAPRRPLLTLGESDGEVVVSLLAEMLVLEKIYEVYSAYCDAFQPAALHQQTTWGTQLTATPLVANPET